MADTTHGRSSSRMEEDHAMLVGHEQILQQVSVTHAEIEGMVKQNQTMLQDHETRIRSLEVKLERRGASLKVYPPADPQPVISRGGKTVTKHARYAVIVLSLILMVGMALKAQAPKTSDSLSLSELEKTKLQLVQERQRATRRKRP